MAGDFKNIDYIIKDSNGKRWFQCEFCGKKAAEEEFVSHGGKGKVNIGKCYDCLKNNPAANVKNHQNNKKIFDPNVCPQCGGQLVQRSGKFGPFRECSNYPKCNFTR